MLMKNLIKIITFGFLVQLQSLIAQEIPDSLEKRIKKEVINSILNYRVWVNPEIPLETHTTDTQTGLVRESGLAILLPEGIRDYDMILEVEPIVAPNGYVHPHFYKVQKKGNCFTNPHPSIRCDKDGEMVYDENGEYVLIEAYEDTLCYDFYDQHFPFDEWYLVYYNPNYRDEIFRISGAFMLSRLPLADPEWMYRKTGTAGADASISARLYRYGTGGLGVGLEAIFVEDSTGRGKVSDINSTEQAGEYYQFATSYPVWRPDLAIDMIVRVKKEDIWFSEIEFVFYSNDPRITGSEENRTHEIIYTLYTDKFDLTFEDALPKVKLLSKEEYSKMISIMENNSRLNIYYYVDWYDLEAEGYFDKKEE